MTPQPAGSQEADGQVSPDEQKVEIFVLYTGLSPLYENVNPETGVQCGGARVGQDTSSTATSRYSRTLYFSGVSSEISMDSPSSTTIQ